MPSSSSSSSSEFSMCSDFSDSDISLISDSEWDMMNESSDGVPKKANEEPIDAPNALQNDEQSDEKEGAQEIQNITGFWEQVTGSESLASFILDNSHFAAHFPEHPESGRVYQLNQKHPNGFWTTLEHNKIVQRALNSDGEEHHRREYRIYESEGIWMLEVTDTQPGLAEQQWKYERVEPEPEDAEPEQMSTDDYGFIVVVLMGVLMLLKIIGSILDRIIEIDWLFP